MQMLADAGSPLIWATLLQLTIGNYLLGVLETFVVRRVFGARGAGVSRWIIGANYVSAFVGLFLLSAASDQFVHWIGGPLPVYHVRRILITLALLSFVLTILIEWPFYLLAMRGPGANWRRSFNASLVANAASYAVLAAWYWMASMAHFGVTLVNATDMPANPTAQVFYLTPNGADIYRLRLDGSAPMKFTSLRQPAPQGTLALAASKYDDRWQLGVQSDYDQAVRFVADIGPCRAAVPPINSSVPTADLQGQASPKWTALFNYPSGEFYAVDNRSKEWHFILAFDAPWMTWMAQGVAILPKDQMVFELGGQIMWVDMSRGIAAAVAAGHGPVVVLDKEPTTQSTQP
ncbi:MAG: hypothetical protein ABSH22_09410 [Tepidisphaeraceae bacterium]|jgi:hypothetical protein